MALLVYCYFHVLCHAVTIQHVTEVSQMNVEIKITNNNQCISQCRVYIQKFSEFFEEIDHRLFILLVWWWAINHEQNHTFSKYSVNFKLIASKELMLLNVFKDVALTDSLCNIAMPPPRRLHLGW